MFAALDDYSPGTFIRARSRVALNGNSNLRHYSEFIARYRNAHPGNRFVARVRAA